MIELIEKLDVFSNVKFFDDTHEYFIDGKKVSKSATKLISNIKIPFDSKKWSAKKAKERGISVDEILAEWAYTAKVSTEKGTVFHSYAENYLANRVFPYPESRILAVPEFKGTDPVKDKYIKLTAMFRKFHSDIQGKMISVKSEYVVGDAELDIAGMIDQIFYNKKSGKLEIWDWKTNKEISASNRYQKYLAPMSHLDECEMNTYSLQLNIYKYLITKHTGLEFGDCFLCWFNENNDSYKVIRCHDFQNEAKLLLEAA